MGKKKKEKKKKKKSQKERKPLKLLHKSFLPILISCSFTLRLGLFISHSAPNGPMWMARVSLIPSLTLDDEERQRHSDADECIEENIKILIFPSLGRKRGPGPHRKCHKNIFPPTRDMSNLNIQYITALNMYCTAIRACYIRTCKQKKTSDMVSSLHQPNIAKKKKAKNENSTSQHLLFFFSWSWNATQFVRILA